MNKSRSIQQPGAGEESPSPVVNQEHPAGSEPTGQQRGASSVNQDFAIPLIIGLGTLLVASMVLLVSPEQGAAAAAGVGLGVLNYQWLYRGAVRFFEAADSGNAGQGIWVVVALLRMGILVGGLAVLLKLGLSGVGLVAGLSVPVFSQIAWSSYRAFHQSVQARS